MIASATNKLQKKRVDLVVANNAEAMESLSSRVLVVGPDDQVLSIGPGEKTFLANELLSVVLEAD